MAPRRRSGLSIGVMRTLIVGIGALGGTIATRALAAGMPLSLATRTKETARSLRASGLRVSGVGGAAAATSFQARALEEYQGDRFDLVLLATKAHEALEISPLLAALARAGRHAPLHPERRRLAVSSRIGLEATAARRDLQPRRHHAGAGPDRAAQRRPSAHRRAVRRGERARGPRRRRARPGVGSARHAATCAGAVWSKLLLNCSVTTIGAVAARTMREYMTSAEGRAVSGAPTTRRSPSRSPAAPAPGADDGRPGAAGLAGHEASPAGARGLARPHPRRLRGPQAVDAPGLRARPPTEVDFINGYVADLGARMGVPVPINAAIAATVHLIEEKRLSPEPARLAELLRRAAERS